MGTAKLHWQTSLAFHQQLLVRQLTMDGEGCSGVTV